MYLKILIQNSENGDIYDITGISSNIQISTEFKDQAGKLTFQTQRQNEKDKNTALIFEEGSRIQVKWKDRGIFFGYLFKRQTDEDGVVQITAYDQLRYLKNKDFYQNRGETLATTFGNICQTFNLKYQVDYDSGYKVPPKIFDDTSLYEILKYSIDSNLIGVEKQHVIYDDYGTLKLNIIDNLRSDYVLGDLSMVTNYRYEKSIDDNTYNQIKLVKEDKKNKSRGLYIVKNSDNQKRWGVLQYYKKVDENVPDGVLQSWGKNLLNTYDVVHEKLSLTALAVPGDDGIWDLRAGSGIIIKLNTSIGYINGENEANKYEMYLIEKCTHEIENENYHSLSLDIIKLNPTKDKKE